MNKNSIITIYLAFILLFSTLVLAVPSLDILEDSLGIDLSQGSTKEVQFAVKNTGTEVIDLEFSHDLDLTDRDGDKIILDFSNPDPINPGEQATITLKAEADFNQDIEDYSGKITVSDKNSDAEDTIQLKINIALEACDAGEVGNDLQLEIKEPDTDDEFKPGDEIPVKVEVKNVGEDDIQVQVSAFLITDSGFIVEDASSESLNVENDEEEEFDFSLTIPTDNSKVRDGNERFTLVIKAFDDDNENINCIQEETEIELDLERHEVIIENAFITPSTLSCGDSGIITVEVANIGEEESKGFISIENRELKISQRSNTISLDDFDSLERNRVRQQFSFSIPKNAKEKEYLLDIRTSFDSNQDSEIARFQVISCDSIKPEVITKRPVTISLIESKIETMQGSRISIPVEITNNQDIKFLYFISLANTGDIGESASVKSVLLNPGQSSTVFLDVSISDLTALGKYTPTIEVRDDRSLLSSEPILIEVNGRETESPFPQLPLMFWIIIDLVILGLIALGIITLFKRA